MFMSFYLYLVSMITKSVKLIVIYNSDPLWQSVEVLHKVGCPYSIETSAFGADWLSRRKPGVSVAGVCPMVVQ